MPDPITFFLAPEYASFWEIQRHFLERTLNMNAIREALLVFGVVVGVLVLVMLILHFRPKKAYVPQDWILDAEQIRNTISVALNQRANFELQFALEGETRRPALRCSLMEIGKTDLLVEASGMASLSSRWEGRSVECFFMLRKLETYSFYAFSTTLKHIKTTESSCRIRLSIPERIESRQKRSYLRINPPEEYTLGAALWRGVDMPEALERNDLSLWTKPSRLWLPGTREEFCIRDISSGGMRLHLPRQILAEEMDFIHVSNQYIVMLDLWEPDKAQRLRFWLLCRMQSPVLDFESKGMDIGTQFLAWGKPAETGGSGLLWLKLASSGEVEPLGNWIMRRHLEFFRDSEQSVGFAQRQGSGND